MALLDRAIALLDQVPDTREIVLRRAGTWSADYDAWSDARDETLQAAAEIVKVAAPSIESLEGVLREIKQPGHPVSTRTTIVLSTLFEKPGIAPVEAD